VIANYGYEDGSGDFFIALDTDKCNGCGACVRACPCRVLEVGEDPNDPLREEPVAFVRSAKRKKIKYACAPCKPNDRPPLPCQAACEAGAIDHSW
jgi:ferredoxin